MKQEQQGREIYYHLDADKMEEIEKWLGQFKQLLTNRFNQLDLEKIIEMVFQKGFTAGLCHG